MDNQEIDETIRVPEELLEYIVRNISYKNLLSFGRHLGLDPTELDEIKFNYEEEGLDEIRHGLRRKFLEKFGFQATLERVISALEKIGRKDLMESIISYGNSPAEMKISLNKTRFKECLQDIREYMIKRYLDIELPREACIGDQPLILHENYMEQTLTLSDKFDKAKYGGFLPIENIFDNIGEKMPKIILIESDPGFGKTTLSLKLASDWANQKDYIRQKFDLVFYSNAKNVTENVEEFLLNEIRDIEDITEKEKLETVKTAKEKVLLILDDFHELDNSYKQKLQLHNLFKSLTVIITSITDEMKIQNENIRRIPNTKSHIMKSFWDKRIQIKGITHMLPNNYDKNDEEDINENYELWLSYMPENIYYYPPLFMLVAHMIRNTNPSSITEFFSRFISCLVKRILVKKKVIDVSTEIDILKQDDVNASYYRLFFQFGRLALFKLFKNEISFSREEILLYCNDEDLFRLGFLRRIIDYENYRLKITYETFYTNFLEFFASFYVSIALKDDSELLFIEKMFRESHLLENPESLLRLLIVGLAKDDAHVILKMVFYRKSIKRMGFSKWLSIFREMSKTYKNIYSFLTSLEIKHFLFYIFIIFIIIAMSDLHYLWFFMMCIILFFVYFNI